MTVNETKLLSAIQALTEAIAYMHQSNDITHVVRNYQEISKQQLHEATVYDSLAKQAIRQSSKLLEECRLNPTVDIAQVPRRLSIPERAILAMAPSTQSNVMPVTLAEMDQAIPGNDQTIDFKVRRG